MLCITPLEYAVHSDTESPVFGEGVTKVRVDDEAGGFFLVLAQEDRELRIDPEEFPHIIKVVKMLLKAQAKLEA